MELLLFDFVIKYIPGATNTIPDALSRRNDYVSNVPPSPAPPLLPENCFANFQTVLQNPFDEQIIKDV